MRLTRLFPQLRGLHIDRLEATATQLTIAAHTVRRTAPCPLCQRRSRRVHSRYQRRVGDLPCSGRTVVLLIRVRRFICTSPWCPQRIFAERLPHLVSPRARHSVPLRAAYQRIGLIAGAEAGARLARTLQMPVSPATILRQLRTLPSPVAPALVVVGVDDFAFRRGQRYGTVLCDHEQRRIIDLLPDRAAESVRHWLHAHPSITTITRDRGGCYIEGATHGAPQAQQVADRWHLCKNLREEVEKVVLHERQALPATISPLPAQSPQSAPCSAPEVTVVTVQGVEPTARDAEDALIRASVRQALYEEVRQRAERGEGIRSIARHTHLSRNTVRRYLRAPVVAMVTTRHRRSCLDPFKPYLQQRWQEGCHAEAQLLREVREQGYRGGHTILRAFLAPWRRHGAPHTDLREQRLSPRTAAGLFLRASMGLDEAERATITEICAQSLTLQRTYALVQEFGQMVRERRGTDLDAWITAATASGIAPLCRFACSLREDYAAAKAGLMLPYSNGPTEGFVNKLKTLKRQMYGRCSLDLLRLRLLHGA